MLSEEQIKKLISANESLQVQLADANEMLGAREKEIAFLNAQLGTSTALRSQLDGHLAEMESIQNQLGEKQQSAKGAEEREFVLHQELTGMAQLNKEYNELVQDYAYLQSQYRDILAQLNALQQQNLKLEHVAGSTGALQSRLDSCLLERDILKERVNELKGQNFLKGI